MSVTVLMFVLVPPVGSIMAMPSVGIAWENEMKFSVFIGPFSAQLSADWLN